MFKKLTEMLEAEEISKEVADAIDSEISTALKDLRDESAGWRVKYQDLNKNFETISKAKDDLEAKIENFDDAIQKAKEEGKGELVRELESQRKETQSLQANLEAIQNENKTLRVDTSLSAELAKYNVVDAELVGSYLKGKVSLDGDNIKYTDGENSLSLGDGLKSFFENKPHLLKAQGSSGSGAGNGANSGGAKTRSTMSDEEAETFIEQNGHDAYMKLQA